MFDTNCEYRALFRCHVEKCSQFGTKWQNYPIMVSDEALIFKEPVIGRLAVIWARNKRYYDLVADGNITDIFSEQHYEIMALQRKCSTFEQAQKSTSAKLTSFKDMLVPIGTMLLYGGIIPPTGYLLCNGQAIPKDVYPDLYHVIGTSFGKGDGATTFNLPDFRGRVPAGYVGGTNDLLTIATTQSIGGTGGTTNAASTLALEQIPSHYHSYTKITGVSGHMSGPDTPILVVGGGFSDNTSTSGGNQAHSNIMPFMLTNVIIKAL